jgi:hypothetical protein
VLSSEISVGNGEHCCQALRRAHEKRHPAASQPVSTPGGQTGGDTQDSTNHCRCNFVCETHRNPLPVTRDGLSLAEPPLLRLMPKNLKPEVMDGVDNDLLCIGQALDQDQEWYVDGFPVARQQESKLEDPRPPAKDPSGIWLGLRSIKTIFGIGRSAKNKESTMGDSSSSGAGEVIPGPTRSSTMMTQGTTSTQEPPRLLPRVSTIPVRMSS